MQEERFPGLLLVGLEKAPQGRGLLPWALAEHRSPGARYKHTNPAGDGIKPIPELAGHAAPGRIRPAHLLFSSLLTESPLTLTLTLAPDPPGFAVGKG